MKKIILLLFVLIGFSCYSQDAATIRWFQIQDSIRQRREIIINKDSLINNNLFKRQNNVDSLCKIVGLILYKANQSLQYTSFLLDTYGLVYTYSKVDGFNNKANSVLYKYINGTYSYNGSLITSKGYWSYISASKIKLLQILKK
jgi:hypothetical protein